MFASKGVAGAGVKDIAAEAGVTAGLLYHYFPGKQALLLAVLAERGFLPELLEPLDAGREPPAGEVLVVLAAGFGRLLAGYLTARTTAGELRVHDTQTAAQMLLSVIVLGQVTGRPPDPGTVVELILHGLALPPDLPHPTEQ